VNPGSVLDKSWHLRTHYVLRRLTDSGSE